jgi:hypothetical protein
VRLTGAGYPDLSWQRLSARAVAVKTIVFARRHVTKLTSAHRHPRDLDGFRDARARLGS